MSNSPFKFLDAYGKEDADIFFGRSTEIEQLYNQVYSSTLLLVYGTTGTGKTSLIQCGLGNMFEDTDWLPLFVRKGRNIVESLETALHEAARRKDKLAGQPIRRQVHSVYLDYYKPIYLLFDQFEELFILGDREEEDDFFWLLSELQQANLQCKILLIMREEYLAHLDRFERIVPTLFDNRFRVERMRREKIEEVIRETAANDRFHIELASEAVVDQIVDNLSNEQGHVDLANLQVYLDRLYRDDLRRQQHSGQSRAVRFDEELLRRTGKLDDVLARFLDEQLSLLDTELKQQGATDDDIALSVLAELVTSQETKQSRKVDDLKENLKTNKNINPEYVDYCVQRLMEMRILRELV